MSLFGRKLTTFQRFYSSVRRSADLKCLSSLKLKLGSVDRAAAAATTGCTMQAFSTQRPWHCSDQSSSNHAKRFNFIADAAEIAAPAVVYVEVKIQQGNFLGGVAQGAGSGFVVTDYGVILTNAHVVSNANNINVKLASGDVRFG